MDLSIKKILVPTDFSEPSLDAVRYAGALARDHGAEILLLNVVPPTMPLTPFGPGPILAMPMPDQVRRDVKSGLEAIKREQLSTVPHVRVMVSDGIPHSEIVTVAEGEHADLIVIGSIGHSAMAAMFLGSTAERVARRATCPVLLFRAPTQR